MKEWVKVLLRLEDKPVTHCFKHLVSYSIQLEILGSQFYRVRSHSSSGFSRINQNRELLLRNHQVLKPPFRTKTKPQSQCSVLSFTQLLDFQSRLFWAIDIDFHIRIVYFNFSMKPIVRIRNWLNHILIFIRKGFSQGWPIIIWHGYILNWGGVSFWILKIKWPEIDSIESAIFKPVKS